MERAWTSLSSLVDAERHRHVQDLLAQQEKDAEAWRDACLLYFQQFSKKPLPKGVEPPSHTLDYYKSVQLHHFPGTPSDK
jgi:alpha-glucuronidase